MAAAEVGEVAYLEMSDFHQAAVEALGVDVETARRITNDTLAGSALAAPAAGFGDFEKYPDFATKSRSSCRRSRATTRYPMGTSARPCSAPSLLPGSTGFVGSCRSTMSTTEPTPPGSSRLPQPARCRWRN